MAKPIVTLERLREVLDYNQETGIFTWKKHLASRGHIGRECHCINSDGYICIGVEKRLYVAHRLAWFYIHGTWPKDQIDHINGIKTDNRIINLREADGFLNMQNLRKATKNNTGTGFLGVSICTIGKTYRASIKIEGKKVHLGTYPSAEEAHEIYKMVKRIHHPGCTI